jgi:hypothetical protein
MTTLLHSFGDYIVLTVKKSLKIYITRNKIINEFRYILPAHKVVATHNTIH